MSESSQSKEVVEKLIGWVEKAESFASREAPQCVREVLLWERWGWLLWAFVWVTVAVTLWVLTYFCYLGYAASVGHSADGYVFIGIFTTLSAGGASLGAACALIESLKTFIAPRVVILHELQRLL